MEDSSFNCQAYFHEFRGKLAGFYPEETFFQPRHSRNQNHQIINPFRLLNNQGQFLALQSYYKQLNPKTVKMENQKAFNEEFMLSEGNYSFEESNQMKFTNFLDLSSIFQPISILHDDASLLNETERQQIEEEKTISGNRVHSNGNLFSNVVDQEEKESFSKREKSFSKSKGQKDRTGIQTFSNGFKIDSQCSDNISGMQKGQCNEFDFVFKQQKIKGKYHKNTNVPKMLVRIFVKYFSSFVADKKSLLLRHHAEIKKEMQERPTNNYKIPDVLKLLEAGCEQFEGAGTQNRRTMAEIILKTMEQEIILNRFVKRNQMSYMLAMKIYALRCRSRKLVERVKIM